MDRDSRDRLTDPDIQDAWVASDPVRAVSILCQRSADTRRVPSRLRKVQRGERLIAYVESTGSLAVMAVQRGLGETDRENRDDQESLRPWGRRVSRSGAGTGVDLWWVDRAPDPVELWCPSCGVTASLDLAPVLEALATWYRTSSLVEVHVDHALSV